MAEHELVIRTKLETVGGIDVREVVKSLNAGVDRLAGLDVGKNVEALGRDVTKEASPEFDAPSINTL